MPTFSAKVFCVVFLLIFGVSANAQKKLVVEGTKGNAFISYRTQPGETINFICVMFKTDAISVIKLNGLSANGKLPIGRMIKIPFNPQILRQDDKAPNLPTAVVHKVATGENLYRISLGHNNIDMDILKKWNRLPIDAIVSEGDEVVIGFLPMEGLGSGYIAVGGRQNNQNSTAKNTREELKKERENSLVATNSNSEKNKTSIRPDSSKQKLNTSEKNADKFAKDESLKTTGQKPNNQSAVDPYAAALQRNRDSMRLVRLNAQIPADNAEKIRKEKANTQAKDSLRPSQRMNDAFAASLNKSINPSPLKKADMPDSLPTLDGNEPNDDAGTAYYPTAYKQIQSTNPQFQTSGDSMVMSVNLQERMKSNTNTPAKNNELTFYNNLMNEPVKDILSGNDIKQPEMYVDSLSLKPEGFFASAFGKNAEKLRMQVYNGNAMSFKAATGWNDRKYYILLNDLPPGSIVRVNKTGESKFIYAKVLWNLDNIRANEGLDYRINDAGAAALGITETKFPLTVTLYK